MNAHPWTPEQHAEIVERRGRPATDDWDVSSPRPGVERRADRNARTLAELAEEAQIAMTDAERTRRYRARKNA